jgi:hypothetical protein
MLVYAFLFAILAPLPVSAIQFLAASGIVTLVVAADLLWGSAGSTSAPFIFRAALTVAKYATAFTFALAVCFVLYVTRPDVEPGPSVAGPSALTVHLVILVVLNAMAFFTALAASQHYPSAVGLMFLNASGLTLAAGVPFMVWYFRHAGV